MDKETLSKYGWVVIVIIVLVILMSFAAPFGSYVKDNVSNTLNTLTNAMIKNQDIVKIDAEGLYQNNFENINKDPLTYYTAQDISNDSHLYGIGATKPEYVVAEFNEDYTELVITKNIPSEGAESDGKMRSMQVGVKHIFDSVGGTVKTITVKDGVTTIGTRMLMAFGNTTTVNLGNTVQTIGSNAFDSMPISEIVFPESLTFIGENAFYACKNLTKVTFLSKGTVSLYSGAFTNCYNLKSVVYHGTLDYTSWAFQNCKDVVISHA